MAIEMAVNGGYFLNGIIWAVIGYKVGRQRYPGLVHLPLLLFLYTVTGITLELLIRLTWN
jgi:hypothetical protein